MNDIQKAAQAKRERRAIRWAAIAARGGIETVEAYRARLRPVPQPRPA